MKLMLGVALMLVCGGALADTAQQGKILRFVVESNYASIWLENQPTNNECPSDGRWVIDFAADSIAKEKYSAILTAASTRTPVVLHYASSEGCSAFGAKRVQYIDLSY